MTKINLIDTHAHFNSVDMANLGDEITTANKNDRVSKIINVGLDFKTSEEAIQISLVNPKFYSTLGIHPLHEGSVESLKILYSSYPNDKIVAIGETGFDMAGDLNSQIKKFLASINLANELHLPLIIHLNTHDLATRRLCIETIKRYRPLYGFIFHYFQPDLSLLEEIISLGGYISVGANITKANAKKSLEVVKSIPIENLIIETDYPYMTAYPRDTGKSSFEKIVELRGTTKTLMMRQLDENAHRLFTKLK